MRLFAFLILITTVSVASAKNLLSNPAISLNTLLTYQTSDQGNNPDGENTNGFSVQEVELRMTANIDSNFYGDVTLALENEDGEFGIEPEEAFVETLTLPDFKIRAGKFYAYWGRHNLLHTHSFPFIDAALTRNFIFGEEGFNETGLAVSYLVPTPWYFEIVAQALSGDNAQVFGSNSQDDVAGVYYLKNLWDLNKASTLQLDLGLGHGHNINNERNHIYNATLTYKWRPVAKASTTSFAWTAEYTMAEKLFDEDGNALGRTAVLSTWAQYQFAKQWWAQLRTEFVDFIETGVDQTKKHSALIGFIPSEFSAIRLQYDNIDVTGSSEKENRFTIQLNTSIGSHPAHTY